MDLRLFNIGDIVALKAHPYYNCYKEIIISGDHTMIPPLMVVIEIYKAKLSFGDTASESYKYRCTWFSSKQYKFVQSDIYESDLKLIEKSGETVDTKALQRGDKLTLKTSSYELSKKKSSFIYEDNQINAGTGRTTINSLLSFLPPLLQLVNITPHKSDRPLKNKSAELIRIVHSVDVKFSFFNPADNIISIQSLPLEALEIVAVVQETTIQKLKDIIDKSGYLHVNIKKYQTIIEPRNIIFREGYYFLRAFDYLKNKVEEFDILHLKFKELKTPFKAMAPKFDIGHKPEAATAKYIMDEIIALIKGARKGSFFIRFKYNNRNDQLSNRTLMNFELIKVHEEGNVAHYLVGYCLLRKDKRSFRIDRIQNVQKLNLTYK